ncbi:MAG: hypothetical protein LBJ46_08630 [Planctomycetota bacterium]|jgi:two-component system sensor histidine kinase HydH|nr:hypothetical protein [Planctomycetota bacterium]
MDADFSKLTRRSRKLFGLSPWLVVGLSVILGVAVILVAVRGNEREKEKSSENLMNRANALIWALEAGTRTWLGVQGEKDLLQLLVEETAKQPDIVYLVVAEFDGTILAHSDKSKVGEKLPAGSIPGREDMGKTDWRVANSADASTFEVYRLFAPILEDYGTGERSWCHHRYSSLETNLFPRDQDDRHDSFVLVGLDQRPFQEALQADFHNAMLSAFIIAALGLGGFISMFWAHNYQRSSRLLLDAQALTSEVITNLPLGLITCGPGGGIEIVNPAASAMLGKPEQNLEGSRLKTCTRWNGDPSLRNSPGA